jgi:hypothetical protein
VFPADNGAGNVKATGRLAHQYWAGGPLAQAEVPTMTEMIETLGNNFEVFVVATIGVCVVFGSLMRTITGVMSTQVRERSRREIAAYIAEGSLTPEQGERLIKAEVDAHHRRAC